MNNATMKPGEEAAKDDNLILLHCDRLRFVSEVDAVDAGLNNQGNAAVVCGCGYFAHAGQRKSSGTAAQRF